MSLSPPRTVSLKPMPAPEFDTLVESIKCKSETEEKLLLVDETLSKHYFDSLQLLVLFTNFPAVTDRLELVSMVVPNLSDPLSQLEYFVNCFSHSAERKFVQFAFSERILEVHGQDYDLGPLLKEVEGKRRQSLKIKSVTDIQDAIRQEEARHQLEQEERSKQILEDENETEEPSSNNKTIIDNVEPMKNENKDEEKKPDFSRRALPSVEIKKENEIITTNDGNNDIIDSNEDIVEKEKQGEETKETSSGKEVEVRLEENEGNKNNKEKQEMTTVNNGCFYNFFCCS